MDWLQFWFLHYTPPLQWSLSQMHLYHYTPNRVTKQWHHFEEWSLVAMCVWSNESRGYIAERVLQSRRAICCSSFVGCPSSSLAAVSQPRLGGESEQSARVSLAATARTVVNNDICRFQRAPLSYQRGRAIFATSRSPLGGIVNM